MYRGSDVQVGELLFEFLHDFRNLQSIIVEQTDRTQVTQNS